MSLILDLKDEVKALKNEIAILVNEYEANPSIQKFLEYGDLRAELAMKIEELHNVEYPE